MSKISMRWKLLLIVGLGISLAWTNKGPAAKKNYVIHRYALKNPSMDGTKFYVLLDITSRGLIKGLDYDCDYSYSICSFAADQQKMHTDNTGTWFYVSEVPSSGIDYTGSFFLVSY